MEDDQSASRIRQVFIVARSFVDAAEREAYLHSVCESDQKLRRAVDELLNAKHSAKKNPLMQAIDRLETMTHCLPPKEKDFKKLNEAELGLLDEGNATDAPIALPKVSDYEVISVIGEGGMGTIYLARQPQPLAREVALKVIKPGMDSRQVLRRFRLEQQALALMDHPNIATVFDAGQTEAGYPYFVMELVRGIPIDEYCVNHQLSLRDRLLLFVDVCAALQHAHERTVLHRDLKPSNVLVKHGSNGPLVKVIDFGVAKSMTEDSADRTQFTHLNDWIGTPMYMSPEQVSCDIRQIDTRSDVYGLGALLYTLVVGEPPITRDQLHEVGFDQMRTIICQREPQRPSVRLKELIDRTSTSDFLLSTGDYQHWWRSLQGDLDWIILKALEKEPHRRFESAERLAEDILRYLNGEPISASPPSIGHRFSKFAKRKRSMLLALGSMACIVVFSACWVNYFRQHSLRVTEFSQLKIEEAENLKSSSRQTESRIAGQERKSLDLLEATRIQQLLLALGKSDFARMSELPLPRERDGSFLRAGRLKESNAEGSLRQALTDLTSPSPVREFEHPAAVTDGLVSPDQQILATTCRDGWLRLWDLESGQCRSLGPHMNAAEALVFSPTGDRIASGDKEGCVYIWEVASGEQLFASEPRAGGIQSLAWSDDGRYLAAGVRYAGAVVLLVDSGEEYLWIPTLVDTGKPRYESLLFSPDCRWLYVPEGSDRGFLGLWDIRNRALDRKFDTAPLDYPRSMCLAGRAKQWLIATDRPRTKLLFLDAQTGEQKAVHTTEFVHAQHLCYSAEDQLLAAAYLDGKVAVWSLEEDDGLPRLQRKLVLAAHDPAQGNATRVQWLDDGRLLTTGEDGFARAWQLDQLKATHIDTFPEAADLQQVNSAEYLALEAMSDAAGMQVVLRHTVDGPNEVLLQTPGWPQLAKRSTGHLPYFTVVGDIMAISEPKRIHIWRRGAVEWQAAQVIETSTPSPGVVLDASGQRLAVMSDQHVQIFFSDDGWDSSRQLGAWEAENELSACFVDAGRVLVLSHPTRRAVENVRCLEERDCRTGELLHRWPSEAVVFAASHNEQWLAMGGDSELQVVDRVTQQSVLRASGIPAPMWLRFLDEDRIVLALHADERMRAWHVPTSEALGIVLQNEKDWGTLREVFCGRDEAQAIQFWFQRPGDRATCVSLGR